MEVLSRRPLWLVAKNFTNSEEEFWYLRVQHLVSRELQPRVGCWKTAYYSLASNITVETVFGSDMLANSLVVKILIELGCDPSMNNNSAILHACENGYVDTVRTLLEDSRIDPSYGNNSHYSPLVSASLHGRADVVRLLLADPRIDPSQSFCLIESSAEGHLEVVRLLLEDGRVDPSLTSNLALELACWNNHTEVVKLLLACDRLRMSAQRCQQIARRVGVNAQIVELLRTCSGE